MKTRNIKLTLEYDGGNYHGWQRQPRMVTVQGLIEKVLADILQEKIILIGSGRTDAGVHARGQVASFKTRNEIPLKNLKCALNGLLPDDILIKQAVHVPLDFHARYSAESKLYEYSILNSSLFSPFLRNYTYFFPYPLDIKSMKKAAKLLVGKHDFSSFRASDSGVDRQHCIRNIKKLRVLTDKDLIRFCIEADGFLYNMVRIIAGTLVEVGRGKIPVSEVKVILNAKNRQKAGPTLPAKGLCLLKVKYFS